MEEMASKLHAESQQHLKECDSPFGSLSGITKSGVAAYSNCNDKTVTMEDHAVVFNRKTKRIVEEDDPAAEELMFSPLTHEDAIKVTTGMKWQCVEFARRFLLQTYGLVFGDCNGAYDIWRMTYLYKPHDAVLLSSNPVAMPRSKLDRFPNFAFELSASGSSVAHTANPADSAQPRANDVVIWPIHQKEMPFGHVAIITEILLVDENGVPVQQENSAATIIDLKPVEDQQKLQSEDKDTFVAIARIAEQNYHNQDWALFTKDSSKSFSREVHVYRRAKTNKFGLKDPDGSRILGWMRARPDVDFKGAFSHSDDGVDLDVQGSNGGLPKRVFANEANTMEALNNQDKNGGTIYDEAIHGERLREINGDL